MNPLRRNRGNIPALSHRFSDQIYQSPSLSFGKCAASVASSKLARYFLYGILYMRAHRVERSIKFLRKQTLECFPIPWIQFVFRIYFIRYGSRRQRGSQFRVMLHSHRPRNIEHYLSTAFHYRVRKNIVIIFLANQVTHRCPDRINLGTFWQRQMSCKKLEIFNLCGIEPIPNSNTLAEFIHNSSLSQTTLWWLFHQFKKHCVTDWA